MKKLLSPINKEQKDVNSYKQKDVTSYKEKRVKFSKWGRAPTSNRTQVNSGVYSPSLGLSC
jgi:hypothetical protein